MTDLRNPYLPEAPADGQHVWSSGPADLGGNRRCTLCGAYRGSEEGQRTCLGEYKESGKMRAWAADKWEEDRAQSVAAPEPASRQEIDLFQPNDRWKTMTFPDGQPHISTTMHGSKLPLYIRTRLASTDDLMRLLLLMDVIDRKRPPEVHLNVSYLMGARMDRPMPPVYGYHHPFTLKVVANLINQCRFDSVTVFDPHSEVSVALIDRCQAQLPFAHLRYALKDYDPSSTVIVAPDLGAAKRTWELAHSCRDVGPWEVVQCTKKRDPSTGRLSGFNLASPEVAVREKRCLIVDDLCDGGGTFAGLASLLSGCGAASVDLYVSHGVFSKAAPGMSPEIAGIDHVWTTNSYQEFPGSHWYRFHLMDWYAPY